MAPHRRILRPDPINYGSTAARKRPRSQQSGGLNGLRRQYQERRHYVLGDRKPNPTNGYGSHTN